MIDEIAGQIGVVRVKRIAGDRAAPADQKVLNLDAPPGRGGGGDGFGGAATPLSKSG